MIYERIIKQNACEKVLGKPNLFAKGLPFKKRNDFKSISKLVLFTSNKKGAMFCLKMENKY